MIRPYTCHLCYFVPKGCRLKSLSISSNKYSFCKPPNLIKFQGTKFIIFSTHLVWFEKIDCHYESLWDRFKNAFVTVWIFDDVNLDEFPSQFEIGVRNSFVRYFDPFRGVVDVKIFQVMSLIDQEKIGAFSKDLTGPMQLFFWFDRSRLVILQDAIFRRSRSMIVSCLAFFIDRR